VCSTGVSTVTNISLIWDLVWTRNFTRSGAATYFDLTSDRTLTFVLGSGVSRKQRSLLIIVMLLLVYVAFGALVNSFLIKLNFIDALYFTVVSIETVGFGDISPNNTSSRVFMSFYIICGILNLGVAVGVARETIFEQLHNSYQQRLAKIRKRYQDHRNWRVWERKWKRSVEWRLREINAETWMPDLAEDSESTIDTNLKRESKRSITAFISRVFHFGYKNKKDRNHFRDEGEIRGVAYGHPGTHLNVETLPRAQLEAAALESGIPLCVLRALRRRRAYLSRTHTITSVSSASTTQYWRRWFWSEHEPLPTERPTTPFMRGLEDMSGMLTKFAIATTGVGMKRMPEWSSTRMDRQRSLTLDSVVSETTTLSTLSSASLHTIHDDFQEIANREERKAFWAKVSWGNLP
jgi:potassium channel subfamily K